MDQNKKIVSLTAIVVFTLIFGAALSYFVWPQSAFNEFDQKTVSNPKLVELISQQQLEMYQKYAGYLIKKLYRPKRMKI